MLLNLLNLPTHFLQELTTAPTTMADVPSCVCPILEGVHVNVGEASPLSMPLPVPHSRIARLDKNPALTVASVSSAAGSVTDRWTVQTSQMNTTVSLEKKLKRVLMSAQISLTQIHELEICLWSSY